MKTANGIIDRIYTPGLAQVAYLVADDVAREVAVIDPRRDVDVYLDWAGEREMKIVAVLETHVHADFVSGAPELAERTGAPVYASRLGELAFPHMSIDDGDEIRIGVLRLRALHTPGHTPEHMAYLLFEEDSEMPRALFSGDVLFVGDVGRPDLLGKEATERLSHQLFETVTNVLKPLPVELRVYPGHTGGSACGKQIGDAPDTTIGAEKQFNYAFQHDEREAFVDAVMEGMPKPPAYYPELKKVNKVGARAVETLAEPRAMNESELQQALDSGALVLDVRDKDAFGEGHIPGAIFAGFGPNFHLWVGWMAPYDRDIVLVTGNDAAVDDVVTALRQIGLDRVRGYLDGGMSSWAGDIERLPQVSPAELADRGALPVLDVRGDDEWTDRRVPGAAHQFLGDLMHGAPVPAELRKDDSIAVMCGSGYRSTVAASILQAQGYTNLINVDGGITAWNEANLPVVSGE